MKISPTMFSFAAPNPPRKHSARSSNNRLIVKFVCSSKAQAERLERFYKADEQRLKDSRRARVARLKRTR